MLNRGQGEDRSYVVTLRTRLRETLENSCHYDTYVGVAISHTRLGFLTGPLLRTAYRLQETLGRRLPWGALGDPEAAAVLGRGRSLQRTEAFAPIDVFVTANFRTSDLSAEPVASLLRGKRIVCFGRHCEPLVSIRQLLRYNVVDYRLTWLAPDGSPDWWRRERVHRKPESVGLDPAFLPETVGDFFRETFPDEGPGTGLTCVIYAAAVLECDHVFIAGIDFYDDKYASGRSLEEAYEEQKVARGKTFEEWREGHEAMKDSLNRIVERFTETTFHLVTNSDAYEGSADNVVVYGPDDDIDEETVRSAVG